MEEMHRAAGKLRPKTVFLGAMSGRDFINPSTTPRESPCSILLRCDSYVTFYLETQIDNLGHVVKRLHQSTVGVHTS